MNRDERRKAATTYNDARPLFTSHGEVMHGYTTHDLTRMARYAVRARKPFIPGDASLGEMAEVALAGITDALIAATEKPAELTLMRAGQEEIRRHVRKVWLYDQGLTAHGTPNRNFYKFWGEYLVSTGRTNKIAKGSHAA